MDVQERAELALIAAVEALLEPEVVELALEAHVLGVPVLVHKLVVLEYLGLVHDVLALTPAAVPAGTSCAILSM